MVRIDVIIKSVRCRREFMYMVDDIDMPLEFKPRVCDVR